MFATLGVNVAVVESRARLLGFLDAEISGLLADRMRTDGIRLCMPDTVSAVEPAHDALSITLASGETMSKHAVLVCSGRTGNSQGLGLNNIVIQPNSRGHIEVSPQYQTAVPNVYAVGDVIGFPALASTSMEQGRVAMVHAFDLKYKQELATILPY